MPGPEFIVINGLTLYAAEVAGVGTNPDNTKTVKFKNGVTAVIPKQENSKAAIWSSDRNLTCGYFLNGVTIYGNSKKEDGIVLTNSEWCNIYTTENGYTENPADRIQLLYEGKREAGKNYVSTGNEDSVTVTANTQSPREIRHTGQFNRVF